MAPGCPEPHVSLCSNVASRRPHDGRILRSRTGWRRSDESKTFRNGLGVLLSRWAVVNRAGQSKSARDAMIEAVVVIAILTALSWLAPVLLQGYQVLETPTAKNTAPAGRAKSSDRQDEVINLSSERGQAMKDSWKRVIIMPGIGLGIGLVVGLV